MKIALLGDIHGNHFALAAVLSAASANGVERLLITGDLVGYYFWPKEVMDLLAPWNAVTTLVSGNHETMLAQSRGDPDFLKEVDKRYGTGLRIALDSLSTSQLDWLTSLPHPQRVDIGDCRILLCHGAPWDVDQYIYPDADRDLLENCASDDYDWVVLGHTHYAMHHTIRGTHIVNPGSVGQPRNRKAGAQWALLDTESRQVDFKTEHYDVTAVIERSRALHPEIPYLSNVFLGIR